MVGAEVRSFIAECFWPGVQAADVRDLDERARRGAAATRSIATRVRYLGSILMPEDEVVLCEFEGDVETVRLVAESAAIPFDRIVETRHSPWGTPPFQ